VWEESLDCGEEGGGVSEGDKGRGKGREGRGEWGYHCWNSGWGVRSRGVLEERCGGDVEQEGRREGWRGGEVEGLWRGAG